MRKRLFIFFALLYATDGHALLTNILRDTLHDRAVSLKSLAELRNLPVTLSLGSDYIVHNGLPMRSGLQRFVFELYQGTAALTELIPNVTGHAVVSALIGVFVGPNIVLHEVGGHGHAASIFLGARTKFYHKADPKSTQRKDFLRYLPYGIFSFSGATFTDDSEEKQWPEGVRSYNALDSALRRGDKQAKDKALKELLATRKNFDFYQRYTRFSYAGINMEIEQARYVSHRILQGEVVRPETVVAYAVLGVFSYFQMEGDGLANDANAIAVYYESVRCKTGAVKRARMLSMVGTLCSGTFWSFARAYWRMERVQPLWIFDRVLFPNFYVFYTLKGFSMLVESAVRLNDRLYIDFGGEWVVDPGKDPFTHQKYSAGEFRLGAGWHCCKGLFVSAYSLLNHFGGGAELTYTNQSKHFGVSMGATWASDKSLSGERVANYAFNDQGRDLSGYVRLSYVI